MAIFSVHFDGDITFDHKVSVRVLGKTYTHMQRAIDRAYLIGKYGEVHKNERLTKDEYRETEFIALYPQEGGIILDAIRNGAEVIIDRIAASVSRVYQPAVHHAINQFSSIENQLADRRQYAEQMGNNTQTYKQVMSDPPSHWAEAYSNRSVVKEIDHLVSQVTRDDLETTTAEITLVGKTTHLPLTFNKSIAKSFHQIVSNRELGPPMIAHGRITVLDGGNKTRKPSAKFLNFATGKEVILHMPHQNDFNELHPFHNIEDGVRVHVCPMLEAGGFDLHGGDLMYLRVA